VGLVVELVDRHELERRAVAALLIVLSAAVRVPVALLGGSFATVTALATMVAGWHRAADATAAFLVVGVCTMVAISLLVVFDSLRPRASARVGLGWWVALSVGAQILGGTSPSVSLRSERSGTPCWARSWHSCRRGC
jgi:hypothetical protein